MSPAGSPDGGPPPAADGARRPAEAGGDEAWLLTARGIFKRFPGVQALADVNLSLGAGEVLCVVGENGAGKSTLMKILGGVYRPDAGQIVLAGRGVEFADVHAAQSAGVVLIHQELNLADGLDVAGNLFLGREPRAGGPLGFVRRRIYDQARAITDRLGLDCSPRTIVAQLSPGQKQLVEIGRALGLESRVLIMDEPTSSLTERETERLFQVIGDLKRAGVSIVYISHRLKEVGQIADRVTVLRDGRNAGELDRVQITHDALVRLMVGRELRQFFHRQHRAPRTGEGQPAAVLRAEQVRWTAAAEEAVDFEVRRGEIVGMAGLMGSGRSELAETLFGLRPMRGGRLLVDGKVVRPRSPREAIAAGIFLIPEDRRHQGLVLSASVAENLGLVWLRQLSRGGMILRGRHRELAERMCRELAVKTPSLEQTVGLLSGGNQQKVVLGKWLARRPRVLILDEPTRGVDVGAKAEIYALMDRLAAEGVGVLMISSDLEEILGTSDRVLVMHQRRLAGQLAREQLSEEAVMRLATGGGPV